MRNTETLVRANLESCCSRSCLGLLLSLRIVLNNPRQTQSEVIKIVNKKSLLKPERNKIREYILKEPLSTWHVLLSEAKTETGEGMRLCVLSLNQRTCFS